MWKRVTEDLWPKTSLNYSLPQYGINGILSHIDKVPFYFNKNHCPTLAKVWEWDVIVYKRGSAISMER